MKQEIIFIDDEEIVLRGYERKLAHKFKVSTYISARLALENIKINTNCKVVVVDLRMPEMEGSEFIAEVNNIDKSIISVVVSGKADMQDAIEAVNQGNIFQFITKPYEENQLIKTLEAAITQYDLSQRKRSLMAKIQEQNEKISSFTAMLVHDLKNPFYTIQSATSFLLDSYSDEYNETTLEMLQSMNKSSESSAAMIGEMMEVLRIKSGKLVLKNQIANPYSDIIETIDSFGILAANKNIKLITTILKDLPKVEYDQEIFQRVLANLLSNAIKYSRENSKVIISVEKEKQSLRFIVQDTGLGLNEKDLEHVFEEYRRLSAQPTGGESSTGLGLATVKSLVAAMGGEVGVHSEGKNLGATFWFSLKVMKNDEK